MNSKTASARTHFYTTAKTPVGLLKLVATDAGLAAILWENDRPGRVKLANLVESPRHPVLLKTKQELTDYFAGKRERFTIPLDPTGTVFQKAVWKALGTIPHGETRTYGQIARQVGRPKAVRAVGAANGRNPVSIIAPCHRVIGADGSMTGFAGGIATKEFLLGLEKRKA